MKKVVMILGSVVQKNSTSTKLLPYPYTIFGFIFIAFVLCHLCPLTHATPIKEVEFVLAPSGGACTQTIALYEDTRLTIQFPQAVRVAIPSVDDSLELFINESLIVISPKKDLFNHHSTPPSPSHFKKTVSITTELQSGQAFLCTFDLFPKSILKDQTQNIELIRIRYQSQDEKVESKAIRLLNRYMSNLIDHDVLKLKDFAQTSPHLHQRITQWRNEISTNAISTFLNAPDFKVSSLPKLRAQNHLIYINIERAIKSNDMLYLRVSLQNRSQAQFTLKTISAQPLNRDEKETLLWSKQVGQSPLQLRVGHAPTLMSLQLPYPLAKNCLLHFQSSNGRQVSLDLTQFTEL